jgi:hypothetical protein
MCVYVNECIHNLRVCSPVAAALEYFDADSYLDIVVANYDDSSVGILGNGDESLMAQKKI